MVNEELEEGEKNPIQFEDMPYFNFMMNGVNRLAFYTADDPFFKGPVNKYYPEVVVFDTNGEILEIISPTNKLSEKYQMTYMEDFRDLALKINDDRKIQI